MASDERRHRVPDLRKLAKANPRVDLTQLKEADALLRQLRRKGIGPREYDLASPYGHRPLRRKEVS
jgi:hypothetical protein